MEKIALRLQQINFQENCEELLTENRPPNFVLEGKTIEDTKPPQTVAPVSLGYTWNFCATSVLASVSSSVSMADESDGIPKKLTFSTSKMASSDDDLNETLNEKVDDDSDQETEDGDVDTQLAGTETDEGWQTDCSSSEPETSKSRYSLRRKEAVRMTIPWQKIKRRSIMKPSRKLHDASNPLSPADIKRIYMNKNMTSFRPSNLETIFEEPQRAKLPKTASVSVLSECETFRFVGTKKMRRSLSCSDGLNANKTLIKQRRAKIKKTFGRRFALKKIALDDFLTRLQTQMGTDDSNPEMSTRPSCWAHSR